MGDAPAAVRRGLERLKTPWAALAAFAVVLALALALAGSDDPAAPAPVQLPEVTDRFIDPKLGVTVGFPEGWKARRKEGVVEVRRRGRTGLVTVAAPAPAPEMRGMLRAAVGEAAAAYRRVERLGSRRLALDGGRAEARMLLGTNGNGARLRILIAGVRGDRRAYLVSAFLPQDADLRLLEVEQILNSLRFEK